MRWPGSLLIAALAAGLILGVLKLWPTVPPSRETTDLQYLHDARTDLCFASRYGGVNVSSYVMVLVPCSPAVRALTTEAR